MAWEWVGPVVTGVTAVAGIAGTALTAHLGRKHAETLSKDQMAHERTMADETRKHSRIAEAYVEVLDMVAMMANFVSRIRPIIETDPAPPTPPMPPVGTQAHVDALMLAFASAEVLKLYESWRESVQATITADRQIEFLITLGQRGAPQGDDLTKLMRELGTELKPASETARKALVTGIAAELGSRI